MLASRDAAFDSENVSIFCSAAHLSERSACAIREPRRGTKHDRRHGQRHNRQGDVRRQHVVGDPDDHQRALDHPDERKPDRLLNGVGIVGDATHYVARFVFAVVAQR